MNTNNTTNENEIENNKEYISQRENILDDNHDISVSNISYSIYRYKFTQPFMDELYQFSKIHQYDHRKEFKEAWNIWCEDNEILISDEIIRLTNKNYKGDVLDKMFKSARYYFRKKGITKIEPQSRRDYIGIQKNVLDAIDRHILVNIQENDYKPSDGFIDFCQSHIELLKEEVKMLINHGIKDSSEIRDKFKKTYKNRHFLLINRIK